MALDELTIQQVRDLLAHNATALARLNEHLQAMLPVYVETSATSELVAASSTGKLIVPPTRDTFFKITGLFVSVPLGTIEADLSIGNDFDLPLQNTTTLITPMQKLIRSTDTITLNFETGADNGGQAFAWLWGDANPSYGKL